MLKNLNLKAGFVKNNTVYSSEAQWIDGDKVRFQFDFPEKLGGWSRLNVTSTVSAVPRAIHTWVDLQGQKLLALGLVNHLSLYENGSDYIDITPTSLGQGNSSNIVAFGYGSGPYSGDYTPVGSVTSVDLGYSLSPTSVSSGVVINLFQWSIDNYGEDLIANPRGEKIYRYDRSNQNSRAVPISGAPTKTNTILIAEPAPYLVAYGTCVQSGGFDPLLVRWADLNDFTNWDVSGGTTAGDFRIQGGSEIIGALKTKRETLVFTDDVVYSQKSSNNDEVFRFDRLGNNCGLISQNAAIDSNSVVYWMGLNSFYKYAGVIQPVQTPIDEAIFNRNNATSLNFNQKEKVYCGINSKFSEIWWLYPSRDSLECDRYIIHNYLENLWYDGTLDRTVWTDGDVFEQPIAANPDGVLFQHEIGKNDDGQPMVSWIKTGIFDIDDGNNLFFIDKFVPDFNLNGGLTLNIVGKKYPNATSITKGPFDVMSNTPKINFRMRARQFQYSVSSSVLNGDFRFGTNRINIQDDGER